MYVRQPLQDAVQEVLHILGKPSHEVDPNSEWGKFLDTNKDVQGLQYEIDETIYILRAALGLPVRRQRCLACGACDSIYWERNPQGTMVPLSNPNNEMWCHECGELEPPNDWITEIVT